MVFSSSLFLFVFFPVVLALYFFAADKYRNYVLLCASLFFYAWGEPKTVILMLFSILFNYVFGFLVEKDRKYRTVCLIIAVAYNLGALFIFKYLNFTVDIISHISGYEFNIQKIALPIGISFYTFQIMSYVIDVYRGNAKVQKNLFNLALYVSLFPQLIAGPIVRYSDVEKQIVSRITNIERTRSGAIRFAVGFSKKVLIADQMSALVDTCFSEVYPSVFVYWVGAVAYSLQIYFDFSGYSDMAIGIGRIFGFDFLENFNYPYISKSIQEFWRRWHISLGSWFKDYLYIPLGGNRKGKIRTYVNYLIVFFLTGLWHGASFNFIVWGLFYAVFIIIERLGWNKVLARLPVFIRHAYALFVIIIGWVFFRADTLTAAIHYIRGMFTLSGNDIVNFIFVIDRQYVFFLILGVILCVPHDKVRLLLKNNEKTEFLGDICAIFVYLLAICYMIGSGYSPFLYFRF